MYCRVIKIPFSCQEEQQTLVVSAQTIHASLSPLFCLRLLVSHILFLLLDFKVGNGTHVHRHNPREGLGRSLGMEHREETLRIVRRWSRMHSLSMGLCMQRYQPRRRWRGRRW